MVEEDLFRKKPGEVGNRDKAQDQSVEVLFVRTQTSYPGIESHWTGSPVGFGDGSHEEGHSTEDLADEEASQTSYPGIESHWTGNRVGLGIDSREEGHSTEDLADEEASQTSYQGEKTDLTEGILVVENDPVGGRADLGVDSH